MQLDKLFYKYNKIFIILLDLALVSLSFLILAWIKPYTIKFILPHYYTPFVIFAIIWLLISFLLGKYELSDIKKPIHLWVAISSITFIVLSIVTILLFALKLNSYSRIIVFGTIVLCYILELITFRIFYAWIRVNTDKYEKRKYDDILIIEKDPLFIKRKVNPEKSDDQNGDEPSKKEVITLESGPDVFEYFSEHVDVDSESIVLTSTTTPFNIENLTGHKLKAIINLKKVNDLRFINKFFAAVNHKLSDTGLFIGCLETNKQRYFRISSRYPIYIRQLIIFFDYIINSVLPNVFGLRYIYYSLTSGVKRTISKAEVLGRLVSCGFEIIEYKEINNLTYFVVIKTGKPENTENASYGTLFKMPRIGKDGQIIHVYKFRTMYPYSEYLQDYVLRLNGYSSLGKPADDFRLTKLGKFMRKYWIDELPQLVNVLRGEMILVGIRPLSLQVFEDYPDDVKMMRIRYRPGCIPPYVSLLKQGMPQSIEAERIYLLEKEKNPFSTDLKYFKLAIYNIITNKIRSA